MADSEREDSYYYPGGIPITPQARKFGYEFPVWVSKSVWSTCCSSQNIKSRHNVSLHSRIIELLQACYIGMTKQLATCDDFISYTFKLWFWARNKPSSKKKKCVRLGARLFLDPSTDEPWMYIFMPDVDTIDILKKGEGSDESSTDNAAVPQVGDHVDLRAELETAGTSTAGRTDSGDDEALPDSSRS